MRILTAVIGLSFAPLASAMIAYPSDWTAHQPDQDSLGLKQVMIGTPSYHFTVAESIDGFYTTIKDHSDDFIKFAEIDPATGELVPSRFIVGRDDPVQNNIPERVVEDANAIEQKCLRNPYCSWKRDQDSRRHPAKTLSGDYKNLVVPFKFADHSERDLNIEALKNDLFGDDHVSVKDFFETQSYNKLTMINDFAEETIINKSESYCADNTSGLSLVIHECLAEALKDKSTVGYDTVTFVHSGYGAEYGNQDEYDTYFDDRIWSHSWKLDTNEYSGRYALISAYFGMANGRVNRVGAAVHEIAQAMGAPTQYGEYPGYGLGYYDVMANPWGFDGTLYHCGSMSAYTKALLGWADVEEISTDGTRAVAASSVSNKVYKISRGYPSDDEYLLIENREATEYDKGMRQAGVAIYHIDLAANGVNHYRVALIQADGRNDLERMEDPGDMGDLFHHDRFAGVGPNGPIGPDGSVIEDQNGLPNTKSHQGSDSGVEIYGISMASSEMSVSVAFSI